MATYLSTLKDVNITSPHKTDGVLSMGSVDELHTLLEFKHELNFKELNNVSRVLIQCIYYLKKFQDAGDTLPSTLLVADKSNCFYLHTDKIVKYLKHESDWSIAPSEAYVKNTAMMIELNNDETINPFIHVVDAGFDLQVIIDELKETTKKGFSKTKINLNNMQLIFQYFFDDSNVVNKKEIGFNAAANLLIHLFVNPGENYLHPKHSELITKDYGTIHVNRKAFMSFFERFDTDKYSPKEKEELIGNIDRLIDDETRRRKGEFYTPKHLVDLAHEYAEEYYPNWKDDYIVWDCAAGTGNLTRDYRFENLYQSTLNIEDINMMTENGINPNAVKFQYDFLNDTDDSLPKELKDALENGKVMFFINPPFGTANEIKTELSLHKAGIAKNRINSEMVKNKMGRCSQQLYAQFLYRIQKYKEKNPNIKLLLFSPKQVLQQPSNKRLYELKDCLYPQKGYMVNAKVFADASDTWSVSFTIWDTIKNIIKLDVCDVDNLVLKKIGEKTVDLDDMKSEMNKWIKPKNTYDNTDNLGTTNGINVKYDRGMNCKNSIGYFHNAGNNVEKNGTNVGLYVIPFANANGINLIDPKLEPTHFERCIMLFTSRKCIDPTWMIDQDQYQIPIFPTPEEEKQYYYDSMIYSLFDNSSNQTSIKGTHDTKKYDIRNSFFFMSPKEIEDLANEFNYDKLYHDAKNQKPSVLYDRIMEARANCSSDAAEIFDDAVKLFSTTIEQRMLKADTNPELCLDRWDAGYNQLKRVWKEYNKEEWTAFRKKFIDFRKRMAKLVYKYGWLKNV